MVVHEALAICPYHQGTSTSRNLSWGLNTGQPSQDWTISCKNYIKEAITRIECQYGTLREEKSPSIMGDHPEQDDSTILDNEQHKEYQSLIGIAQWLVTLGRLDIFYAISSLSHFSCCPHEGHIRRLFRVWGYLKKFPNKSISICAQDPVYKEPLEELKADFEDQYEYASKELIHPFQSPRESP